MTKFQFFTKIVQYILLLISISFIIWRLFLREHILKDIVFTFSWGICILSFSMIFLHMFFIYMKFYTLKNTKPQNIFTQKMLAFFGFLLTLLNEIYSEIYAYLIRFKYIHSFFDKLSLLVCDKSKAFYFCLYFIFNYLPRLIIAISFCIDFCWFHKIFLFSKTIWLLFLPLILRILIFYLEHLSNDITKEVLKFTVRTFTDIKPQLNAPTTFTVVHSWRDDVSVPEGYDLATFHIFDLFYNQLLAHIEDFRNIPKLPFIKICDIFIHLIYIFSWGYTLFKVLVNFWCFLLYLGSIGF